MAHEIGHGASGTNMNDQQFGILRTLGGSAEAGQQAMDYANQLYPDAPEADPWEAAFQFFSAMGQAASQPGATVLGSAVGSMQVPMDYLAAKKKEKRETDRARLQTAVSLAPSLKAPVVKATYGKPDFYMVSKLVDGKLTEAVETPLTPKQFDELQPQIKDGSVVITAVPKAVTAGAFKQRTFFRTGFDPVVAKSQTDADAFEANANWTTLPPDNWKDSKGGTDKGAAEVQSSKILDSGIVVTVMKDGSSKVLDAAGKALEGDARAEAIEMAEERGIEIQSERAGGRRAATVAVNTSLTAFDQVGKSRSNIANLEEAKRLVVEEGANTGVLAARLPNWKASTVALETVKNELGLDVVGSVTFGALSQGELNLALNTALPTTLSEGALVDWIDRKISAQKKLQDYLYAQAIYLADGDKTIGDWLRSQKADKEERERLEAERRQAGTDFDFTTMTADKIVDVDISTLNATQLADWNRRMDELGL